MTTQTDASTRALAPDLARGLMLLLIALANVPWALYGADAAGTTAHRAGATGLDAVWQAIAITAVDGRSYPLFAFLFGYGIWQLYTRQQALGVDERAARRLLQIRHLWMIVFGAVHAALLWYGDVLGAYGLIGLIVVWLFLRRRDRTLIVWCIVLTSLLALLAGLTILGGLTIPPEYVAMTEVALPQPASSDLYLPSIGDRLLMWMPLTIGQGIIGLVVPVAVLLAILTARRRILEDPAAHRPLLVRVAIAGIAIGWLGAVPSLLEHFGAWDLPSWTFTQLHFLTGLFGGLGYAAVFALVASRVVAGGGAAVHALTAVGKRSLSCYLLQSVILQPLLCAWGLGLGGVLTQWQAALLAVAVWGLSVVFAVALDRAGRRGPAEWLLRRLAYRRVRTAAMPVA